MKFDKLTQIIKELKSATPSGRFKVTSQKYHQLLVDMNVDFLVQALRLNFASTYEELNCYDSFNQLIKKEPELFCLMFGEGYHKRESKGYYKTYIQNVPGHVLEGLLENPDPALFTEESLNKISNFEINYTSQSEMILKLFFDKFTKEQLETYIINNFTKFKKGEFEYYNKKFNGCVDLAIRYAESPKANLTFLKNNLSHEQKSYLGRSDIFNKLFCRQLVDDVSKIKTEHFDITEVTTEMFNACLNKHYNSDAFQLLISKLPKNSELLTKEYINKLINTSEVRIGAKNNTDIEKANYKYFIEIIASWLTVRMVELKPEDLNDKDFIFKMVELNPDLFKSIPEKFQRDYDLNLLVLQRAGFSGMQIIHEDFVNNYECLITAIGKAKNFKVSTYYERCNDVIKNIINSGKSDEEIIEEFKILQSKERLEENLYGIDYQEKIIKMLDLFLEGKEYQIKFECENFIIEAGKTEQLFHYSTLNIKDFIKNITILANELPSKKIDLLNNKKVKI